MNARSTRAALFAATLSACSTSRFQSLDAPATAPPAPSLPRTSQSALRVATAAPITTNATSATTTPAASAKPIDLAPPAPFFAKKTADEWIRDTFQVQASYAHVLVVSEKAAPAKIRVPALDLATGKDGPAVELAVTRSFTKIQDAIDASSSGDLVCVLPGHYAGFTVRERASGADGKLLHVRALGAPGSVVVDAPNAHDDHWMIELVGGAHHVVLQGFSIVGHGDGKGPWAGIYLSGDFPKTGKLVHHVAIVNVTAIDHAKWGFHSVDTRAVLIEDSVFARSFEEHGAYVSDGSDEYVIRRNVFFGNDDAGLQINLDPKASLHKITHHARLADVAKGGTTRAWALDVLRAADAAFGAGNYPDGRGERFLVEQNVMNANGKGGGGALNLAGLRGAVIQNNLIYGNQAHGIAMWDNGNPFDAEIVKRKPEVVSKDPNELPIFGCAGNVVRNNTVVMSKDGRDALLAIHGSYGLRAFNNVLVNDKKSALEFDATSYAGLEMQNNVVGAIVDENGAPAEAKALAIAGPDAASNTKNATPATVEAAVRSRIDEPWIVIRGATWAPNPRRPDFRPKPGGPLDGHGAVAELPAFDLAGTPRATADIGAFSTK